MISSILSSIKTAFEISMYRRRIPNEILNQQSQDNKNGLIMTMTWKGDDDVQGLLLLFIT